MRNGKIWFSWLAVTASLATSGINAQAQALGILHSFTNSTSDGSTPEGQPLLIGPTLYGVTELGGSNSLGTVYQISTNGTGFSVVYSFTGGTNGANPYCTLVSAGSTLYGMTFNGGVNDGGVVFGLNTNGPVYNVLHIFKGGASDGQYPFGSLTLAGSTLYGMTVNGGTNGEGVIFSISTTGTNFSVIHSFAGGTTDGEFPNEGVVVSGSTLYGTSFNGGSNNLGIVFAYNTALTSNAFSILHHFTGGTNDGANPTGPLSLSGSTLYGLATAGGTNNLGVIFKVNTSGSGYAVLHSFDGGTNDGAYPQFGPLVVNNSVIYGATEGGGPSGAGVLFQMNTDGTDFTIAHGFSGGTNDGAFPAFGPLLSGSILYGTTLDGGSDDVGVVYGAPVSNITTMSCANATNFLTQVSAINIVSSNVVITVPTVICDMYQLQYSNEMVPTNWINTGSAVAGTGSPIQFIEPIASCTSAGTCTNAPAGLANWWPGDGNALDIAGGNNGTLTNGATFAPGEVCQAFSFNGTNQYVQVPNNPVWNFGTNAFTIELWANFSSTSANQTFISCDDGSNGSNKWIFIYAYNCADCLVFTINGTPGQQQIGNFPFTPVVGQWYHIAVTRGASGWTFYVNGSPIGTDTRTFTVPTMAATTPLVIGSAEGSLYFNGLEDEVSIYTNALSATDISNIYHAGPAGKCKPQVSQRFYRVDEFP